MAWTRVIALAELPVGTARPVRIGLDDLLICRPTSDSVHVLEDVCSHDDAALGAQEIHEGCVSCPRHGARFDIATGEVRRSPAPVGITTYPARIDGDWVVADLED
jgi:nitrite reductase/ring-hydroxylating ferredoxin subunit